MMGEAVRECKALNEAYETAFVNLSLAVDLKDVGRFSWGKPAAFFRIRRQIRKVVRSFRPDWVYITPAVCLPGFLKDYLNVQMLKRMGCQLILHLHNKESRWMGNRLLHSLYRRFFSHTQVILLSERLYTDIAPFVKSERGTGSPASLFLQYHSHQGGVRLVGCLPDSDRTGPVLPLRIGRKTDFGLSWYHLVGRDSGKGIGRDCGVCRREIWRGKVGGLLPGGCFRASHL